jgi:AcrR family transcriptional regulator
VDGDLRQRLIDAGVARLEADGLAGLTLRSITRDAGVSHGAPRRPFATFNGLLAAIAEHGLAELEAAVRPALAQPGPVPDRVTGAVLAYLDFAERRPQLFTLLFRHDLLENSGRHLRERSLPILAALIDVIAEETSRDDARHRALAVWTHAHGIATLGLTRALDLAATPGERRALVHASVRAHLSSPR